jgi:hypothetical protein
MGTDEAIPKDAKLIGLHLFYKNDLPEGFGVGLDEQFFTDHPEAQENFVNASQMSIEFYRTLETDEGRQELIADIQSQFNQVCRWMIEHKGRPMDEDWIAYFVILLDDMGFLTEVGLFPNNEYNGPQWIWFNG